MVPPSVGCLVVVAPVVTAGRDVYVYVEGGTEHDYLSYLNSQFGSDLGFYLNIGVDRAKGMTPTQLLDAAESKARELADEQARAARVRGDSPPEPDSTRLPIWMFFDRDENAEDELVRVHDRAREHEVEVLTDLSSSSMSGGWSGRRSRVGPSAWARGR